jgi:hypothetical protein
MLGFVKLSVVMPNVVAPNDGERKLNNVGHRWTSETLMRFKTWGKYPDLTTCHVSVITRELSLKRKAHDNKGTLTEEEGSVQLTSSY